MENNLIRCEDEPIHLCGKIQSHGYVLVYNSVFKCVALSENCQKWIAIDPQNLLGANLLKLEDFIHSLDTALLQQNIMYLPKDGTLQYEVTLDGINYQLSAYVNRDKLLFLELEPHENLSVDLSLLNNYQRTVDVSMNLWQTLSDTHFTILGFDRIMVYKFMEDGSGKVVAETNNSSLPSVLGFRYPEFDIPKQARELYLTNLFRQTPNIFAPPIPIIGLSNEALDLSRSQIRASSPMHLKYLENTGVTASASFSIIIDNKLWGLVCCQHQESRYITMHQRSLCAYLVNYAATRYVLMEHDFKGLYGDLLQDLEYELDLNFRVNTRLEEVLQDAAPRLITILNACGLIIKTPHNFFSYLETPCELEFDKLCIYLNQRYPVDLFTTNRYGKDVKGKFKCEEKFPGIARANIDSIGEYAIYWFRKEVVKMETWAGNPTEKKTEQQENGSFEFSPRTNFDAWKMEVQGESEYWTRFDLHILKQVMKLVRESYLRKTTEIRSLNEKLLTINNSLDSFTHQLSHDIRNPLTTIQLCAEYLKGHVQLTTDVATEFSSYILDATQLINDILIRTIESSQTEAPAIEFKIIPVEKMIHQLINDSVRQYCPSQFSVKYGTLHNVYGDRTLLYQLFMNLISNAIKFSSKQKVTLLEVSSERTLCNHIVYKIKDNGIGISKTEVAEIYSIFKRLSNAGSFQGSGVGMSIVKRITERLNAQIDIESKLGEGTTFTLTFPHV